MPSATTPSQSNIAFSPLWSRATVLFLSFITLLRLFQLSSMELSLDEAYYWEWSRRPSLGYYDQGPMVSYMLYLTTRLFGSNEFGVRIGVLIATLITSLLCVTLAKRVFQSPLAGFLTACLLGLTPLSEVGSLITTYDPLMVVFWAATLVCLERALFAPERKAQNRAWLCAGVTMGLGFLSKHTMLLILPCVSLFLMISPAHRVWFRRPQPYLALLVCLLLYSGVFYWNIQHDWWTFRHLFFLVKKDFGSPLKRFGDFIGSQALLLGPVLFAGTFVACRWGWLSSASHTKSRETEGVAAPIHEPNWQYRFLVCCGLPVFLFFSALSLKAKVQGNWAPCTWLSLTVLWAGFLAQLAETNPRRVKALVAWATGTALFITGVMIVPSFRVALGIRIPVDQDLSNTAYGWREMAEYVQPVRARLEKEGKPVFIAANDYQYASALAFYLPDRPETYDLFLHTRLSMFAAYLDRLQAQLGNNAVYVNDNDREAEYLEQIFERVEWEAPIPIWRRNYSKEPIRTLYIARCYGYKKFVGSEWHEGG